MKNSNERRRIIPADVVRRQTQPVLLDCGDGGDGGNRTRAMSVVPLMDGSIVAGIEVRCSCGSNTVIECVYEVPDLDEPEPGIENRAEENE